MVSFTVTYYKLNLLNQDATTGQYDRGWTAHSIVMAIFPRGTSFSFNGVGFHSRLDGVGFTNYSVRVGSYVKDSFGKYWLLAGEPQPWTQGDVFAFYGCDLKHVTELPFPAEDVPPEPYDPHFYGFEVIDDYRKFEDGFERGWM